MYTVHKPTYFCENQTEENGSLIAFPFCLSTLIKRNFSCISSQLATALLKASVKTFNIYTVQRHNLEFPDSGNQLS